MSHAVGAPTASDTGLGLEPESPDSPMVEVGMGHQERAPGHASSPPLLVLFPWSKTGVFPMSSVPWLLRANLNLHESKSSNHQIATISVARTMTKLRAFNSC